MNDFIIKLLDLKEEDLDSIDSVTHMNHADFLITLKMRIIFVITTVPSLISFKIRV